MKFGIGNITTAEEILKEKHSLMEWMVILKYYPELLEEFEKLYPPQPIQ